MAEATRVRAITLQILNAILDICFIALISGIIITMYYLLYFLLFVHSDSLANIVLPYWSKVLIFAITNIAWIFAIIVQIKENKLRKKCQQCKLKLTNNNPM
jgi:hypothetical protein